VLLIVYAKGKGGHVTNRSSKTLEQENSMTITGTKRDHLSRQPRTRYPNREEIEHPFQSPTLSLFLLTQQTQLS